MHELATAENILDSGNIIQRTNDVLITENIDFAGLLLKSHVLSGLKHAGFERPSPIQLKAIPLGRCGLDLIVQAKSGTGKTCVFSIIALENVECAGNARITQAPQALVLAPTREVAIQIQQVITSMACDMPKLACHAFIGGLPLADDRHKLRCCHIAVGTPGRIKQLLDEGILSANSIRLFILDEADKLLEEGFQETINWIHSSLPEHKQVLALSATYPEELAQHLKAYMHNPTFVRLNQSDPALLGIRQYYLATLYHPQPEKAFDTKVRHLFELLSSVNFHQCLVFSNYQIRAENLCALLNSRGWPAAYISGSREQHDRLHAMDQLKKLHCRILVSTDLTARGIDAEHVNLVVNLDVPRDYQTYLHRIGRAGRYGTYGAAVSFVCAGQELHELRLVEEECGTKIPKLPDPIPVDLARSSGFVNSGHLVTTEQLITEPVSDSTSLDSTSNDTEGKTVSVREFCMSENSVSLKEEDKSQDQSTNKSTDDDDVVNSTRSFSPTDERYCNTSDIAKHNVDQVVNTDHTEQESDSTNGNSNPVQSCIKATDASSICYAELVADYEQYMAKTEHSMPDSDRILFLKSRVDTRRERIQRVADVLSSLAVSNKEACFSVSRKDCVVDDMLAQSLLENDEKTDTSCHENTNGVSIESTDVLEDGGRLLEGIVMESGLRDSHSRDNEITQMVNRCPNCDSDNLHSGDRLSNNFITDNEYYDTDDSECVCVSDTESEDLSNHHRTSCSETEESNVGRSYLGQCHECLHQKHTMRDHASCIQRPECAYTWNQMHSAYMQQFCYYNWQLHHQYTQYYANMYRYHQQYCQLEQNYSRHIHHHMANSTSSSRTRHRKSAHHGLS